jgi:uncharacterized protein (DUF885 family)
MHPLPRSVLALAACAVVAAGCANPAKRFPALATEYVYTTLTFSPSGATQTGLHTYTDPKTGAVLAFDTLLDDFSKPALDRQRAFYREFKSRLATLDRAALDPQTQADYDLLANAVDFALFGLDDERFTERKPQLYAENLGNALFSNISLEYADTATRAAHLAARLGQVPAFVAAAVQNLGASNDVWRRVAVEEMDGVADMIRTMGATFVRGTPAEARYATAQPAALAAIAHFDAFVRDTLGAKGTFDWRMGKDLYAAKWRYYLQASVTPEAMLQAAEDSMRAVRAEMLALARPLHERWFAGHRHAGDSTAVLNAVVGEVLARIGQDHTQRDSIVQQGERNITALEQYVTEHRLLSQTDFSKLKVIPTPVFMRGIYGVGGAVFAPALQPELNSFYWVTPVPAEWPQARAEAKLREYNRFKMMTLSIHEGIPGHVVQGDYANRVTPEWRRLLRAIFGAGSYIEGWAVYTEYMMEQQGFFGADSVPAKLVGLKALLRLYANVIIDVRLQTMGMIGDSAVTLMVRDAFQEEPEATAKLQRAQLDYVQLNLYPVGYLEWNALRAEAERREGTAFSLCRYHDRVLAYGPIPVPAVRRLYFDGVAPTATMPPSRCEEAGSR